jgi:DNA primase
MDIQDIKKQLSITAVLAHYGITAIKNKQIHCPFHSDKTPSMQVYEDKGLVYCHSSNCKNGGKHLDQIEVIQQMDKLSKREAILKAQSMITACLSDRQGVTLESTLKVEQVQINFAEVFPQLHQSYTRSKVAQEYATARNIHHAKLQIGFNSAVGNVMKEMRNCLIFSLKDEQGNITSFYGRSATAGDKGKHYYSANRKGLYHNVNQTTAKVILTESIIDSATLQVHTDFETLALFGTNGFNQEHETLLKSLPNLDEIILFFDGDLAGTEAVKKYSEQFKNQFSRVKISAVETPESEDINSLVQSHNPEILNHLINERKFLFSPEKENPSEKEENPSAFNILNSALDTSNEEYLAYTSENLIYSIIGGLALYPIDKMKMTLGVQRNDSKNRLHKIRQSNLDLYNEEQLQRFIRSASEKLEIGTKQLNYDLAELTELLEEYRKQKIEASKPKVEPKKVLTAFRKEELLKTLKRTDLLPHINNLIGQTGIVGEEKNRLIMWIVFTSRLMANPLHIVCLGASGTGKTYLQERVSELFPKEEKVSFTASTEQAFYYVGRTELKHKIVLVEDMDGANSVLYVLRELQSKSYVSKLVPIKDSKGNMQTKLLEVEGPIVLSGTTTKEKLYEDNANRCLLIYLDNSSEQQAGIMERQRNVSAGLVNRKEEESIIELLQDLQRMLRPIKVVNPFATKLHIPETVFKPLRTNAHYLQFIEAITFIYQHQRTIKKDSSGEDFIETTLEDIELANELLKEVLLAKSDELTKACRTFLEDVKAILTKEKKQSFYKSDIRNAMRINPNNLKHYLTTLHFYGYIQKVGGNKFKGGYEYEITNKHEYEKLQNDVTTALDKALAEIRKIA